MALQKQVNLYKCAGVPGDKATPDQSVYTPVNPLANTGGVTLGRFVFPVVAGGVTDNSKASNAAGTATAVLGFAERAVNYGNVNVLEDGTMFVPAGSALTVAVRGDYWAVSTTAAVVGHKVLASTTDGTISTAASASSGNVDTGWVVKTAAEIGEPFIMSNWKQIA